MRVIVWVAAVAFAASPGARVSVSGQGADWAIPAEATNLQSPVAGSPDALKKGQSVFESRCRPCHGPEGKGNGPLSDPAHPAADLTAGVAADLAPDGVLFYRVWNGKRPMPAFKSELTQEDVWAVVEYIKSLKKD
jgi:mono/diheme cytochrome c family protein